MPRAHIHLCPDPGYVPTRTAPKRGEDCDQSLRIPAVQGVAGVSAEPLPSAL
jgi:hypothetical protein